ncbi:hypothetical protein [Bacteroides thetaiotaomicron]|uniref:hypothetical protein n=1 Tax=Bacteroides thetaiotaomicron TaxID=818 RepID=UPI003562612F
MDVKDCGPVCFKMIVKYYGKYYSSWLVVLFFFDRKVGELICSNRKNVNFAVVIKN